MSPGQIKIIPSIYRRIVSKFPQDMTLCFAYGSAVKKQIQNDNKENMIDLIFAVKDPIAWHEANLQFNKSHYSALKYFGPNFIARYQKNFGAKVYFNTLCRVEGYMVKYGVISDEDLITDLLEWSDLYVAGRLHKPVEIVNKPVEQELETALQLNLRSSMHAALLLLPDTFTEYEFYHTLSNLSYSGDFRMKFGENKKKVDNIVRAQILDFRDLYRPLILSLPEYVEFPMLKTDSEVLRNIVGYTESNAEEPNYCQQDTSPMARLHHLNQLPRWPQKILTRVWNKGNFRQDTEDVLRALAYDPDCAEIVKRCLNEIVWNSSVNQSVKGILTAGLVKSVRYSLRKLIKMAASTETNNKNTS